MKAIDILFFTALLSGCALQTGSEAYIAPEIVQAEAVVVNQEVRLRCTLSSGRAQRCGFYYGPAEEALKEVPCLLEGTSFELQADHLIPGQTYEWYAFASAGDYELQSEKARFTVEPLSPNSEITIPDPAFREYLLQRYDLNADGAINLWEAERIRRIEITPSNQYNLRSLRGIECMPNLEELICWGDWYNTGDKSTGIDREHYYVGPYRNNWETAWGPIGTLEYVDVSNNPKLRVLHLDNNSALGVELGAVDVSHNPLLEELQLGLTWLEYPDISNNSHLKIINFSLLRGTIPSFDNLPELRVLNIEYPQDEDNVQAHDIDVSGSPLLEELILSNTARSLSDLSHNPKLRVLHWTFCRAVGPIDLSVLPDLEVLGVVGCQLTELDITHNPKLRVLYADDNPLKSIDFSNNSALEELHLSHTLLGDNERGSVDFSPLSNLQYLSCDVTGITALDVTHNPHLQELRCWLNSLTELDLSHNPELKYLFCDENQIASLPLSANTQLEYINCLGNRLTELDLSALSKLCCIDCRNNFITTLDVSRNPLLGTGIWDGQRVGLYCSPMNDAEGNNLLETLFIADGQTIPNVTENRSEDHVPAGTQIVSSPEESSPIFIEDVVFLSYLCKNFDTNEDGIISTAEARKITEIYVDTDNVHSLRGIEQMPNLTLLSCRNSSDDGRGGLTELDLSGNAKLSYLDCSYNRLQHLNVKCLPHLSGFHCNHNILEELDVTENPKLQVICANANCLTSIDVSNNPLLTDLHVDENRIEVLDLSHNLKLREHDTYLAPMEDEQGNNLLKTLYLASQQRSLAGRAPGETQIIYL